MLGLILVGGFVGYFFGGVAWIAGASFLQGLALVSLAGTMTVLLLALSRLPRDTDDDDMSELMPLAA